jgi:hypothetical protein
VSPCHLIVAGTAGTGKSFVLKACTFLVQHLFGKAVIVSAATGSAAAQVGGTTIHSLLKLNPKAGSGGRESDSAHLDLQAMCADLKMLQIDERLCSVLQCWATYTKSFFKVTKKRTLPLEESLF